MSIRKLKDFFSSMTPKAQSIRRLGDGFSVYDGGRELPLQLSEIVAVNGTKVDKVTYEENYLVLTKTSGEKVPVGELADGFAELEQAIYELLRGFPRQWRVIVEKAPAGESIDLWTREPRAP